MTIVEKCISKETTTEIAEPVMSAGDYRKMSTASFSRGMIESKDGYRLPLSADRDILEELHGK